MTGNSDPGSLLVRLRTRAGLSEGQLYTVALLALVAVLLISSLTRLSGRIAEVVASPVRPADAPVLAPPAGPPPAAPPQLPDRRFPAARSVDPPRPPDTTIPTAITPPPPGPPLTAPEPPPSPPCGAQPLIDIVRGAVAAVDPLTGGILPDATVVSALAVATGCSAMDPAILLLAALIEIGQGLPDLGLGVIELPALPFLEIPRPVVDLVQPVRAVLDPICNTVATVTVITSQVGPMYPPPIDAVFAISLFYALATCGQLQDA